MQDRKHTSYIPDEYYQFQINLSNINILIFLKHFKTVLKSISNTFVYVRLAMDCCNNNVLCNEHKIIHKFMQKYL